ncbi:MAG: sialidase family protein [Planctomycetota bacterium]|nr:sialidase family protein [Planctomycetota bacterium]
MSGAVNVASQDLFVAGAGGAHTWRIPSLLRAANGDVLAFCEARRDHAGDSGQIDVVLRRSRDDGLSWGAIETVLAQPGMTCGNNCPVLERRTGRIVLTYCCNRSDGDEGAIRRGEAPRTVHVVTSDDHGASWSPPRAITAAVKKRSWNWYGTGPGHGVQLADGRLVIPCYHNVAARGDGGSQHAHLILSDDGGETWAIGALVSLPSGESCAVQGNDGALYLNARSRKDVGCRVGARSCDGGASFRDEWYHDELPEPARYAGGCEGSLLAYDEETLLFSNPIGADEERCRLTLRASHDDGRSWNQGLVLCPGISAYSDLLRGADGSVLCLYERGERGAYSQALTLARIAPSDLPLTAPSTQG